MYVRDTGVHSDRIVFADATGLLLVQMQSSVDHDCARYVQYSGTSQDTLYLVGRAKELYTFVLVL